MPSIACIEEFADVGGDAKYGSSLGVPDAKPNHKQTNLNISGAAATSAATQHTLICLTISHDIGAYVTFQYPGDDANVADAADRFRHPGEHWVTCPIGTIISILGAAS